MDEIQNCIQDAQYGMALRGKDQAAPTKLLPRPPPGTDLKEVLKNNKLDQANVVLHSPIGRHFLSKYFDKVADGSDSLRFLNDCLADIYKFKKGFTNKDNANKIFERYSGDFEKSAMSTVFTKQKKELDAADEHAYADIRAVFDPISDAGKKLIEKSHFEGFLGDQEIQNEFLEVMWAARQRVGMEEFLVFRDLGRGAFGAVSGSTLSYTGQMFALKCMNRKQVKGKKAFKLTMTEKNVLHMLGNKPTPFCIHLRYSFFDAENLYFALPLCSGGDLLFHLRQSGAMSPARAQFVATEVAMGLNHMHELGIVYRDLKPENVLLMDSGHACISDMGLATKFRKGKTTHKGRAGTPGYWCPEMINKEEYDCRADWFSFGAFLYELLSGTCPFAKSNVEKFGFKPENPKDTRNEAILKWDVEFDAEIFDAKAQAIIKKFLEKEQAKRLGGGDGGFQAIRDDPYFETWYTAKVTDADGKESDWVEGGEKLIWEKILPDTIDAPWHPKKDEINAAHQDDIEERNNEAEYRDITLTEEDQPKDSFAYFSKERHDHDILNVLLMKERGELAKLEEEIAAESAGCCNVL